MAYSKHRSDNTMKEFIKLPFPSLPPFSLSGILRWVDLTRFVTNFDLFFKRTILLLIHHQFLQFWYQCISMKTSICHIIGNFPPNCRRNSWKTDKVYDFLQSAKLTCVDDLWTQKMENPPVQWYTKWCQQMMSNRGCVRWLANRT